MRFAFVDEISVEAQPGTQGYCRNCGMPVSAKCGELRVWHWAHRKGKNCDDWWNPETAWHRAWKDHFPAEWQEYICHDEQNGEKHIADIKTPTGVVVEFQYSSIRSEERTSRENFYKPMVWVVDGSRRLFDYPRFLKGKELLTPEQPKVFSIYDPSKCFPTAWLNSPVPVIFDFRGSALLEDPEDLRHSLYCLFPRIGVRQYIAIFSREVFVNAVKNGTWETRAIRFMQEISKKYEAPIIASEGPEAVERFLEFEHQRRKR